MRIVKSGRIAEIRVVEIKGKKWYVKINPSEEITNIEWKIYEALQDDEQLKGHCPSVWRYDSETLVIEDVGTTLDDLFFLRKDEVLTWERLLENILLRSKVHQVLGTRLTRKEGEFLFSYQIEKLFRTIQKVSKNPHVTRGEVCDHYWAFQVMAAYGFYEERFRDKYTEGVGKHLDEVLGKYGTWTTDNCPRNNAISEAGVQHLFDFNSIKIGLAQMDTAAVGGMFYPFSDWNDKETEQAIRGIAVHSGYEYNEIYLRAFLLCCFHQHHVLIGHRSAELNKELECFAGQVKTLGRVVDEDIEAAVLRLVTEIKQHSMAVEKSTGYIFKHPELDYDVGTLFGISTILSNKTNMRSLMRAAPLAIASVLNSYLTPNASWEIKF